MSLLHRKPVAVQRTYYKPSAMSRLKAVFSPNHHHHQTRPRTTAAAPRRTGRKKVITRQPVRKTGFFHRSSPRRTVIATQRRPGFLASLRPRHANVSTHGHRHHGHHKHDKHHHHGHKGSTIAVLLAAFTLKKKHDHDKHRR